MQPGQPKSPPLLLSFLLALAAACGGSKADQAGKLRQTEQSWHATAQLTRELWQRGTIPAEYAHQALDAAREELNKARRKAEQSSP